MASRASRERSMESEGILVLLLGNRHVHAVTDHGVAPATRQQVYQLQK
jgi:hypothetical protein